MEQHMTPHNPSGAAAPVGVGTDAVVKSASVGALAFKDARTLPANAVGAKSGQDLHTMQHAPLGGANFSNPKSNVQKLGLREGMKVADFGSGSGAYTLALADAVGKTGMVYAVDVQRDLLTRIQNEAQKRGLENVETVWGDIESPTSVAIRDGLLDGVLLSNTLFQLEDKITAVKEAWRVLKPNGMLAVIDWSESFGGLGPQKDDVVTVTEAKLTCVDNDFMYKQEFSAGEHHYGLLFKKPGGTANVADGLNGSVSETIKKELL